MKAECIKMGINGEGIAYIDKTPVFIPGLLPGETAEIQITEDNRSFKRGKAVRIIKTSPYRRKPASEEEYLSGGAELAILDYEQQLYWKNALLEEALWKYGHVNRKLIRTMHASPSPTAYRNECKLPVGLKDGKLVMGLYRTGSNHFIPVDHFSTHTKELEEIRLQVLDILQKSKLKPFDVKTGHGLRFVVIRMIRGQCQLTLVTGKDQLSQALIDELAGIPQMRTVAQSINDRRKTTGIFGSTKVLAGDETIRIEMHGLKLQLSVESFFQMNTEQAEQLYDMVIQKLDPCDHLFEGYCGIGTMSLMAKDKARKVTGAEFSQQAVINAQANAEMNRVPNVTFVCADSAEAFRNARKTREVDCVLVDPPRSGMDENMISSLLHSKVRRIIYVSCNPATLGKNLKELKKAYDIRTIIPYDMFPDTPLVEAICVLERTGGR